MCRYNSQRLLYAQINKSSNGLQEGWGKARISADNIAIVYQGFPPEQSTLLNRTTFRRRRPPKIKCISDVIESYRVLRHRVGGGGSSISSGHSYFSTVYPDTTPYGANNVFILGDGDGTTGQGTTQVSSKLKEAMVKNIDTAHQMAIRATR